jgi:hypothetical protein
VRDGAGEAVPLFASVADSVAVRHAGFKWIIDAKTSAAQVFALATDPRELTNLDGTRPLPADGAKWLAEFHALCPPAAPGATTPGETVDPAVREKLRALGYIE